MQTRWLPNGPAGGSGFRRPEKDWLWLILASVLWSGPGLAAVGDSNPAGTAPGGSLSLDEALDAPNLSWSTGGDFPWIAQTNITHDGQDAAQGKVDYLETEAWMETLVDGPGRLSFHWKTVCNGELDRLAFYVDEELQRSISGAPDWDEVVVDLPEGGGMLRWVFEVDSEPYPDYGAWVDEVSYDREGPPHIVSQPVSQTVVPGSTATFQVVAAGGEFLRYQWFHNWAAIPNATNAMLVLTNVTASQAGFYQVEVCNAVSSATSASAYLTVLPELGTLFAWGHGYWGQTNLPPDLASVVGLAAGRYHSLALRADGTVAAWGGDGSDYEQVNDVPPGLDNVVAIAAGASVSLALRSDGTVVAWGNNALGQTNVPPGLARVVAISAGAYFSLALREDGTVEAWGDNCCGQLDQPEGLDEVVSISAGSHHSLALKRDGTPVGWGNSSSGEADPPSGLSNLVAVSAGQDFSLALKADGTVFGWGRNDWGKATPPDGLSNVVAISAGSDHSLALCADGTVVSWGRCEYDLCEAPPGLAMAVSIDAGSYHSMALGSLNPPAQQPAPVFVRPAWNDGTFGVLLQTALGKVYVFESATSLSAPAWTMLSLLVGDGGRKSLSDPLPGPRKFYRVRVVP